MHSPRHTLVSNSLPIGEKRETNGNENGNEAETKAALLCRNGNEKETKDGNESRLSVALVSIKGASPHPPPAIRSLLGPSPFSVGPTPVCPERDAFNTFP